MQTVREFFLGCPVDPLPREAILAAAKKAMRERGRLVIEGLNVAKLVAARRDRPLMAALVDAGIVHVDGAGVALGARLLGRAWPPRCAGIDLMADLLELCRKEKASVFLLGARAEIVAAAAAAMREQFPDLVIAGYRDGYFSENEAGDIAQHIAASGAALLLVGISSPKKEMFLNRYMIACGVSVAMGVGGAFDIVAGAVTRAPLWMQRGGLEWLYRLMQEPRRLAGRYLCTNSIFAWLLLTEFLQKYLVRLARKPILSWQEFLDLLPYAYGEAAVGGCHEIYFLHRKKYGIRARSVMALLRDMAMLYAMPVREAAEASTKVYAAVSVEGASGVGTIQRAMAALPDTVPCALVVHPRVKMDDMTCLHPARPRVRDGIDAFRCARRYLARRRSAVSRVVVFSCAMRHRLWQASWRRFHAVHPAMTHCLLHNDFDMMSSALVCALSPKVEVVCLQHGIPTDEFFPTRAPTQFVWGESSRAAYALHHAGRLEMEALGRSKHLLAHTHMPQALHLVSQTHTPVYGIDLAARFEALAQALSGHADRLGLRILLHPEEVKNAAAYRVLDRRYIARPPHASLQRGEPACVMIGYASTALLEAALAGHYVAAMDWPATASQQARTVSLPPVQCADAADVLALWHRLRDSEAARASHRAAQQQWLEATFAESGAFTDYFR